MTMRVYKGFTRPHGTGAGFTLIELLVSLAIIVVLVGAAIPLYSGLQVSAQLNESTDQLLQTMRLARSLSVERRNDSPHGVYFDINPNGADRFIFFQGTSYATRTAGFDRVTTLGNALTLSSALSGGITEIVFSRSRGVPSAIGTISLTHTTGGLRLLSLNSAGMVQQQ